MYKKATYISQTVDFSLVFLQKILLQIFNGGHFQKKKKSKLKNKINTRNFIKCI